MGCYVGGAAFGACAKPRCLKLWRRTPGCIGSARQAIASCQPGRDAPVELAGARGATHILRKSEHRCASVRLSVCRERKGDCERLRSGDRESDRENECAGVVAVGLSK